MTGPRRAGSSADGASVVDVVAVGADSCWCWRVGRCRVVSGLLGRQVAPLVGLQSPAVVLYRDRVGDGRSPGCSCRHDLPAHHGLCGFGDGDGVAHCRQGAQVLGQRRSGVGCAGGSGTWSWSAVTSGQSEKSAGGCRCSRIQATLSRTVSLCPASVMHHRACWMCHRPSVVSSACTVPRCTSPLESSIAIRHLLCRWPRSATSMS